MPEKFKTPGTGAPTTINGDVLVLTEEARAKLIQANRERIMALPEGFIEGEFGSDSTLAQRVRDGRRWAASLLESEPESCKELFYEADEEALDRTRTFYHQHLGLDPLSRSFGEGLLARMTKDETRV